MQRIGMGESFPWFIDSALCIGVILHGLCGSKPGVNSLSFPFLHLFGPDIGLSFVYLLAGYYCYISGLELAPYRAFYAMAAVGVILFALRVIERKGFSSDSYFGNRKHSHKH
uniref:Uncharacterized protein n=1 Tax=Nelumbo nucifera TaxID=4432 RepID=A0A822Z7A8_NELNU|nr:TPA_asm: hypothetical protein HUJ06_000514 [Nelumbo nucifera]